MLDFLFALAISYCVYQILKLIYNQYIRPKLLDMDTTIVSKNPKWIVDNENAHYYGFQDIDFLVTENKYFPSTLRFGASKDNRLEVYVPNELPTKDVDDLLNVTMKCKILVKHHVIIHQDKSTKWLCILCYLLDGGDLADNKADWEKIDNKPLDVI